MNNLEIGKDNKNYAPKSRQVGNIFTGEQF